MTPIKLDARLRRRLAEMTPVALVSPELSFPEMFPKRKDLDGAYAVLANQNVDPDGVLHSHMESVVNACEEAGDVLVLADMTDVSFGGEKRRLLGPTSRGGQGFMAHCCLAVSGPKERRVLGVLHAEFWVRPQKTRRQLKQTRREISEDPGKESGVWVDGAVAAEARLAGRARAIHVFDSAADGYEQLAEMDGFGLQTVLRGRHNRTVLRDGNKVKLFDVLAEAEPLVERDVVLSARKKPPMPSMHPPRAKRLAKLHITATQVTFPRSIRARKDLPPTVTCTAIHVIEYEPPEGAEPVQWILLTNLPVLTPAHAAHVVDIYRTRWVIEEFFKALKTGCAVEKRQLEEAHSLMNMTAFFLPIAAKLLDMRSLARAEPDAPATRVFTSRELDVLRNLSPHPMPNKPTVTDAVLAVAKLGGHLKSNGEPGWQVLARGWRRVSEFMLLLARHEAAKRCTG